MSTTDRMVDRLPDAYEKSPGSANARLLQIADDMLWELDRDVRRVEDWGDIDTGTGYTLDLFGGMLGQPRGSVSDEAYRFMLRARIAQNFVSGDYESVLQAVKIAFEAEPGDIVLNDDPYNEATVFLTKLPYRILNAVGMTALQAMGIIKALLPVGVRLRAVNFEGTFRFAKEYAPEDASNPSGFSDIYKPIDPEIPNLPGGYLGLVASE